MTPDPKILAMLRHEFSDKPASAVKAEYKRKKLLDENHIFGYSVSKGELLALFEMIIEEKRCPKPTSSSGAETVCGSGLIQKTTPTPSVNVEVTASKSAKDP